MTFTPLVTADAVTSLSILQTQLHDAAQAIDSSVVSPANATSNSNDIDNGTWRVVGGTSKAKRQAGGAAAGNRQIVRLGVGKDFVSLLFLFFGGSEGVAFAFGVGLLLLMVLRLHSASCFLHWPARTGYQNSRIEVLSNDRIIDQRVLDDVANRTNLEQPHDCHQRGREVLHGQLCKRSPKRSGFLIISLTAYLHSERMAGRNPIRRHRQRLPRCESARSF